MITIDDIRRLREGDCIILRMNRWGRELRLIVGWSPGSKEWWLKDGELWWDVLGTVDIRQIKRIEKVVGSTDERPSERTPQ